MRTSAVARLVVMGILLLCLMVPLAMVQSVVAERTMRRNSAVSEIGGVWGGPQVVGGPVLTLPYRYTWTDNAGRPRPSTGHAHFLPLSLAVTGSVAPEIRRRSLFEVVVYKSRLQIVATFAAPDLADVRPAPEEVRWRDAVLSLGVADPRGISRSLTLKWNDQEEPFAPGVEDVGLFAAGVQAPVRDLSATGGVSFTIDLDLNGSRELRFLPAGNLTSIELASSWPHPSFVGAPLPDSRDTGAAGFTATWRAPYFVRGFSPQWSGEVNREHVKAQADASAFGVALVQPVDIYQQAERAVKYAELFIVMTFVVAFLWEIGLGALLHPIQYLFVGFAMCVFYLLLLSMSEHIGFDVAFASASAVTIALLAWYWSRVTSGVWQGVLMAAALSALYGFLYLLLRLEDYALLVGSIGLFAMLAMVMFFTRRVDWYERRLGTRRA